MKEAILRIWKDPVWSKVIAQGIIGLITLVYIAYIGRIIDNISKSNNISFEESFYKLLYGGEILTPILIALFGIAFMLFYSKVLLQKEIFYNKNIKELDIELLKKSKYRDKLSPTGNNKENIKPQNLPTPKLLRLERNKSVFLVIGLVTMVYGATKFYDEPRPQSGLLCFTYDLLHGNRFYFEPDTLHFNNINFDLANYRFSIEKIEFLSHTTNIHLFGHSMNSDTIFNGIDSLNMLKTNGLFGFRENDLDYYYFSYVGKGFVKLVLGFPSCVGREEHLRFCKDGVNKENKATSKSIMLISNIPPGYGSNIWGIIFYIGLVVIVYFSSINVIRKIREGLTKEGRQLRGEMEEDLTKFLRSRGKSYENLSSLDKRLYNGIIRYYQEIEKQILK